jgi:hypothetical protein
MRTHPFCKDGCDSADATDEPPECEHCGEPAIATGKDGVTRCLECGKTQRGEGVSRKRERERSPSRGEKLAGEVRRLISLGDHKGVARLLDEATAPAVPAGGGGGSPPPHSTKYARSDGKGKDTPEEREEEKRARDREDNDESFVEDAIESLSFVPIQRVRTDEMIAEDRMQRAVKGNRPQKSLALERGLLVQTGREPSKNAAVNTWDNASERFITYASRVNDLHPELNLAGRMLQYWSALTALINEGVPFTGVMKCDVVCRLEWSKPRRFEERKLLWGSVNEPAVNRAFATAALKSTHAVPRTASPAGAAAGTGASATESRARKTAREPAKSRVRKPRRSPSPAPKTPARASDAKRTGQPLTDEEKANKACHFHENGKGTCRDGDRCKFSHTLPWAPRAKRGGGGGPGGKA